MIAILLVAKINARKLWRQTCLPFCANRLQIMPSRLVLEARALQALVADVPEEAMSSRRKHVKRLGDPEIQDWDEHERMVLEAQQKAAEDEPILAHQEAAAAEDPAAVLARAMAMMK